MQGSNHEFAVLVDGMDVVSSQNYRTKSEMNSAKGSMLEMEHDFKTDFANKQTAMTFPNSGSR